MFGFKKNKDQQTPDKAAAPAAPSGYSEVYVMPDKYLADRTGKSGKGLLIAAIILIAVILLTASYLIYDMMSRSAAPAPAPIVPPQINLPEETPPEEIIPPLATTTPEAVPPPATSTAATTPSPAATAAPDTDADGLSDSEETVMGTLPTNPDTDGDGYKDGIEVAAGYNPSKPGTSRINESPFIGELATDFPADNIRALYPKEWRVSFVNAAKQAILTVPTGESIRISVKENALGQSALSWYLQDHPDALASQLKVAESGPLSGIYSINGQVAYLTDPAKAKFYVIEYQIGQQTEIRYLTLFGAIVKSLVAIAAAPVTAATSSQSCLGYMCIEEPCGPLVSGQNSCLSPTLKSTCYEKVCAVDSDCPSGKICGNTTNSCWNGNEAAETVKVCK